MQIKETFEVSFPGSVESPPLEDVVVLVDGAGVALGVQRAFSARVRSVRDGGSSLTASRCVEIPLVGSDGEVSGILCHTGPRSDTRRAVAPRERERVRAIGDVAQCVVHDINNLLAVIGSALRLLECQGDAAYRTARLFLPCVRVGGVPSSRAGTEVAYTPSPSGGVFHIVNPATAAPTS